MVVMSWDICGAEKSESHDHSNKRAKLPLRMNGLNTQFLTSFVFPRINFIFFVDISTGIFFFWYTKLPRIKYWLSVFFYRRNENIL